MLFYCCVVDGGQLYGLDIPLNLGLNIEHSIGSVTDHPCHKDPHAYSPRPSAFTVMITKFLYCKSYLIEKTRMPNFVWRDFS